MDRIQTSFKGTVDVSVPTIYHPLNKHRNEFRVALIEPSSDTTALITVNLDIASPSNYHPFDALSYCWAGLKGMEEIMLCGRKTSVTANLYEALRQLRSTTSTVRLWIDSICINQNDREERSSQVAMMDQLYRNATVVRAWLGPSTPQTEQGFSFLQHILRSAVPDLSLNHIPEPFNETSDFLALGDIFRNPYWQRRWITQEVYLSQMLSIHCGSFQIGPFENHKEGEGLPRIRAYTNNCRTIANKNFGTDKQSRVVFQETLAIQTVLLAFLGVSSLISVNHLMQFFSYKASVDHDYVYGLLGFLPADIGITPDYSLDAKEVFADWAFRFMRYYDTVNPMYLAGHFPSDMPSWVPDLRHQSYVVDDMLARDSEKLKPDFNPRPKISALHIHANLFDASAGTKPDLRSREGLELVVPGLITDAIIATGEKLAETEFPLDDFPTTVRTWSRWQSLYQAVLQVKELPISAAARARSPEDINIDFQTTVSAGSTDDFEGEQRMYRRCTRDEVSRFYQTLRTDPKDAVGVDIDQMSFDLRWRELNCMRNTFFVTARGRMGLAAGEVKEGDLVVIVKGSNMPFRMRRIEGGPKLKYKGVMYVQGESGPSKYADSNG
jgi:hypothetical protein